MKHVNRWLLTAGAIVVAAVPAVLADPSFAHYVAQHPWAATYLPIAAGAVKVLVQAAKDKRA